jgi:hypothetical protein
MRPHAFLLPAHSLLLLMLGHGVRVALFNLHSLRATHTTLAPRIHLNFRPNR